jgi:hypothetical protein
MDQNRLREEGDMHIHAMSVQILRLQMLTIDGASAIDKMYYQSIQQSILL